MVDESAPKKLGIPAWQQAGPSDSNKSTPSTSKTTPDSSESSQSTAGDSDSPISSASSAEARIAQAVKFLTDDTLKDAPFEQKTSFLESKGLSKLEIDDALNRATKASPQPSELRTISPTPSSQPSYTPPTTSQPPALPSRDVPPIITYPDFLMHAQKPPPLITARRLLTTAYVATGIGAAIYGASKYLVTPMADALTEARHDFAAHVQEQIDQLNAKLRGVVSSDAHDPLASPSARKTLRFKDDDDVSDTSSHSDPTELFHRDYGTQTSPSHSTAVPPRSPSSSSDSDLDSSPKDATAALSQLSNSVTALTNNDTIGGSADAELSTVIRVLNEYLESLAYPSYVSSNNGYGVSYAPPDKAKDDEVTRFKAEIRGVKGVLLSARNFPGSGGGRRAAYPPAPAAGTS